MQLPNASRAIIDERKLRQYLLSRRHPIGRYKAAFFADLGFRAEDWRLLRTLLLAVAKDDTAEPASATRFGQKFLIHSRLTGPSGRSAPITSVWIVRAGEDWPRLVTVTPRWS